MDKKDLGHQRWEYRKGKLRSNMLAANPMDQFGLWYADAENEQGSQANPMTLTTVGTDLQPSARIVLLKSFDDQGFVFYSNYQSHKAQQMAANPQVCLSFFWAPLERQVIVQGRVERYTPEAADEYFASRPRGSQLSAWASHQSSRLPSRHELEDSYHKFESQFENQAVPRPEHWGGYLVRPTQIEFWQGQPDRLHDRFVYREQNGNWTIDRLSP